MTQPIDWRARAKELRGPAEPTFDPKDAVREGTAMFVDMGGDEAQVPRVKQLLESAIQADPDSGQMVVTVPGRTGGPGYAVRGRDGLRLFAKQVVDGQRLAALGPDPVDLVVQRLVLRGEVPAATRAAAAGLLWREPDGRIAYRPRASLPVDPNFNASGPPPIRGDDKLIAMAASQLGTAMEADRRRRVLAEQGGQGQARLAAEQQAVDTADAARRAARTVGPYPRL